MNDQSGITVDDLQWIHRDQFDHYIAQAYTLGDPHSWPTLRQDLLRGLTAAFGLDPVRGHLAGPTLAQRRALAVLDDLRSHHDPATHWPAFREALWHRRAAIRPDLA